MVSEIAPQESENKNDMRNRGMVHNPSADMSTEELPWFVLGFILKEEAGWEK